MAKKLVTDELWEVVEPLLPEEPPKPKGGRPRIDDRAVLTGILFVLKSGIPWEMLPQEMGCGSGMTCWRRRRDWHAAGVWERLHRVLLDRLRAAHPPRRLPPPNAHDSRVFGALLDAAPPIKRPRGRPRRRPAKLHADKA